MNESTINSFCKSDELNDSSNQYESIFLEKQNDIKRLTKLINSENKGEGTFLSHAQNIYTICLRDKNTKSIMSLINFKFYENDTNTDTNTDKNYIYINYTYTFFNYRRNGFNKMLRLLIERIASYFSVKKIMSMPFSDANSVFVLEKLGYIKDSKGFFYKLIN
jgi:hypothetical protein